MLQGLWVRVEALPDGPGTHAASLPCALRPGIAVPIPARCADPIRGVAPCGSGRRAERSAILSRLEGIGQRLRGGRVGG